MRIIITGTPGTGKSSVARELAEVLGVEFVDVTKIGSKIKNKKTEVDIEKFKKLVVKELKGKKNFIIENHLLCEFSLPADFIFVLRTRPDVLKKRLGKRNYEKKKLEANLIAEMLDYCTQKTLANYRGKIFELETAGRTVKETVSRICRIVRNKKLKGDKVDYSRYLTEYTKQETMQ
ncbi:AAA family ATPase [Candidatus Micrarchaeota archaeon]|nr:AAA family ATPase [Candidatus Micrarchaeota archaeon]